MLLKTFNIPSKTSMVPATPDPGGRAAGWLIAAILAITATVLLLRWSINVGRLAEPAVYDDVTYLLDGARHLQDLYDDGLPGLASGYVHHPPHAPLSTMMALVGFLVFGYHDWGPYAVNGLFILALLGFAGYLMRGQPLWVRASAMLIALLMPLTELGVTEFRPDIAVGAMTAAVAVLIVDGDLARSTGRYRLATGVLLGLTLWAKPSVFPITLALTGVALVAVLARDMAQEWVVKRRLPARRDVRPHALAWAGILIPAAAVALPHYVINRHEIIEYIRTNALGDNRRLYAHHAGWAEHARYYLIELAGQVTLGAYFGLFCAVFVACAALAAFLALGRKRPAALIGGATFALVLLAAYAGPTLNTVKHYLLATPFDYLWLFGGLLALRWVASGQALCVPPAAGRGVIAMIVALCVWNARWPVPRGERAGTEFATHESLVNGVFDAVAQRRRAPVARLPDDDRHAEQGAADVRRDQGRPEEAGVRIDPYGAQPRELSGPV